MGSPLGVRVDPISQVVDLNHAAVFRCAVVGSPVHQIHWVKNGYPLQQAER